MKVIFPAFLALFAALASPASAAEFTLTFDPALSPGWVQQITNWTEKGMSLGIRTNATHMANRDNGHVTWAPSNGTAYITYSSDNWGAPATLTNTSGKVFSLKRVDLAEYSTLVSESNIEFVGYRADGSSVTNVFTLDNVIDGDGPTNDFERFTFTSTFTNLLYVRMKQPGTVTNQNYSIDNIRLSTTVTNPTTVIDISAGGGTATLTVSNLSMMASNIVERVHEFPSSNWTVAGSFVSSNATAQWSESISNSWTNVYYRIRSE